MVLLALLQVLQKCFHLSLERTKGVVSMMDYTGCHLRVEPMLTVAELEKHLLSLVSCHTAIYGI